METMMVFLLVPTFFVGIALTILEALAFIVIQRMKDTLNDVPE